MILLNYKNNFFKFFIYISALLISLFIIVTVFDKHVDNKNNNVTKSVLEFKDETTSVYVEYPRFKSDKITNIVTNIIYPYVREFRDREENKVLDMTYNLYYFDDYVNITFHIENTLNKIKNKNILINLKKEKVDYITTIYDQDYLSNEIKELVYYKYSSDIYNKIKDSVINNFTYVMNDTKLDIYFNNIEFDNLDYIPYVSIVIDNDNEPTQSVNKEFTKYIAFTYDDGPSNYTKDILKTLELNNSSATFFMLGNRIKYNKDIVLEVDSSNSEIGSHTYSHKNLENLSNEEITEELNSTNILYNSITGNNLKYLRPPYNYNSESKLETGYTIVTWNIDPKDWFLKDSTKIYNNVIKHACDGCIVVMHDIYPETVEATKKLIPKLNEMGYQVVSISKLAEYKGYTLEENQVINSLK